MDDDEDADDVNRINRSRQISSLLYQLASLSPYLNLCMYIIGFDFFISPDSLLSPYLSHYHHPLRHHSLYKYQFPSFVDSQSNLKTASSVMESSSVNGGGEQPHVLAVDDCLIDRVLIERLLKNSSCKVTTAENGLRALEYLGLGENQQHCNGNASKVNMIITDYCMPGMTGFELLKKIKESSATRELPVVIMSSENVPTRINQCLQEGAQMFMLKPIKLADVKKLRGQLMNSRSSR